MRMMRGVSPLAGQEVASASVGLGAADELVVTLGTCKMCLLCAELLSLEPSAVDSVDKTSL